MGRGLGKVKGPENGLKAYAVPMPKFIRWKIVCKPQFGKKSDVLTRSIGVLLVCFVQIWNRILQPIRGGGGLGDRKPKKSWESLRNSKCSWFAVCSL